ncbi:negative regulation of phosphatidylinositol-3,4,5-trisphosphate 5-phosphatase activity [Sparganum proliferum]
MMKAKPLTEEVNRFKGSTGDKEYVRLMESLELLILELDGIGVDGQEDVRNARRSAVRELQQVLEMLEFRGSMSGGEGGTSNNKDDSEGDNIGGNSKNKDDSCADKTNDEGIKDASIGKA